MVSKKIITNFVLLILFLPRVVFSQSINSIYFDLDYWKTFDWNNAEKSLLWSDSGYVVDKYSHSRFLNASSKEIEIEGKPYYSIITKLKKGPYPYEALILSKSFTEPEPCDLLNKRLTQAFGVSSDMTEYTYYYDKAVNTYKYYWQWDAGNTRVTLECGDITIKEPDKNGSVSVKYQRLDSGSKIENPIHLTCPYRSQAIYKGTPSSWEKSNQALDITVLPNLGIITNGHRRVLVNNADITDTAINYLFRTELLDIEYSINRMNGNLTATGINKKEADVKLRFEGVCHLRDPNKRMF